jgi:hypothetical protein
MLLLHTRRPFRARADASSVLVSNVKYNTNKRYGRRLGTCRATMNRISAIVGGRAGRRRLVPSTSRPPCGITSSYTLNKSFRITSRMASACWAEKHHDRERGIAHRRMQPILTQMALPLGWCITFQDGVNNPFLREDCHNSGSVSAAACSSASISKFRQDFHPTGKRTA